MIVLNAGYRFSKLEQQDCGAYDRSAQCATANTIEAYACACQPAGWLGDFPAAFWVYVLPEGACFSLCKPKSEHGSSDGGDQNVIVRGADQKRPHEDNQSNKSHTRIPFFRDKVRNVIQRLASKCFHPVFLSNSRRVVEGGEFVLRCPQLIRCAVTLSSAAVSFKHPGKAWSRLTSPYRWGRGGPVDVPPNLPVGVGRGDLCSCGPLLCGVVI